MAQSPSLNPLEVTAGLRSFPSAKGGHKPARQDAPFHLNSTRQPCKSDQVDFLENFRLQVVKLTGQAKTEGVERWRIKNR
jgi:hypothetical protein